MNYIDSKVSITYKHDSDYYYNHSLSTVGMVHAWRII